MTKRDSATVLVVDDGEEEADSYADRLSAVHEVRTAYSGEQALEAIDESVDVVLLDRRMPDISGDEVLSYVREHGLAVRVAMVTAVEPDFDIIEMAFDDYVVKPVSSEELLDTVDRLLICSEYEARLQEYYSLTVKYITLKQTKTSVEIADSEAFAALQERRQTLRDRLNELDEEFGEREFVTVLDDLQRRYQASADA